MSFSENWWGNEAGRFSLGFLGRGWSWEKGLVMDLMGVGSLV